MPQVGGHIGTFASICDVFEAEVTSSRQMLGHEVTEKTKKYMVYIYIYWKYMEYMEYWKIMVYTWIYGNRYWEYMLGLYVKNTNWEYMFYHGI
jgi:hypothetical protein